MMHEHVLSPAKNLLAAGADIVSQPHVVSEVAERGREIVLFGMQRRATITEAERLGVDASAALASLRVHTIYFTEPRERYSLRLSGHGKYLKLRRSVPPAYRR
jgi:hypothetical protein